MTLMRLLPRDEDGHPRPLRGHGEALRWAAATIARPLLSVRTPAAFGGSFGGLSLARYLSGDEAPDPTSLVITLAGLAATGFALWLGGTVLLYLYALLLGGVEKRAVRGR